MKKLALVLVFAMLMIATLTACGTKCAKCGDTLTDFEKEAGEIDGKLYCAECAIDIAVDELDELDEELDKAMEDFDKAMDDLDKEFDKAMEGLN